MIEQEDFLEVAACYHHPQAAYDAAVEIGRKFNAEVLTGFAFFVRSNGETIMILNFPRECTEAAHSAEEVLGEAARWPCSISAQGWDERQPTVESCLADLESDRFDLACAGPLEAFALVALFWPRVVFFAASAQRPPPSPARGQPGAEDSETVFAQGIE